MSPAVSSSGSDVPSGLRRRTVVAGVAWAVSVIAIGAPAAVAAASTTPTGDICTLTYYDGNDDYQKLDISLAATDRKSTRLNSSHTTISYAVFCLKKKKE